MTQNLWFDRPVFLDGTTFTSPNGNAGVVLNGERQKDKTRAGITLAGKGSVIQGFTLASFPEDGLKVQAGGVKVYALNAINNGQAGITVTSSGPDVAIGDTGSVAGRVCCSGNVLAATLLGAVRATVANYWAGYDCFQPLPSNQSVATTEARRQESASVHQNKGQTLMVYGANSRIGDPSKKELGQVWLWHSGKLSSGEVASASYGVAIFGPEVELANLLVYGHHIGIIALSTGNFFGTNSKIGTYLPKCTRTHNHTRTYRHTCT